MRPYRSMLFVPGHKQSWAAKAVRAGADAIILDLEDSVPPPEKEEARGTVRDTIAQLRAEGVRADVWVRPNSVESGLFGADVEAVIGEGLAGLVIPKAYSAREIIEIAAIVAHIEGREGLEPGTVELVLSLETAESMAAMEEIAASSPRIGSILGATGPNADVGRALGFEFTVEGLESLYLRSRIVLACRANGISHPISGVWQDIADLEGLRRFALDQRQLGYRGLALIHPSHVEITNEAFTPSAEEVDYCRRLLVAFAKAEAAGSAAVDFEGQHIDIAHVKTAQGIIDLADSIAR